MAPTNHMPDTGVAYKAGRDKKNNPGEKEEIQGVKRAAIKDVCKRCVEKVMWRFKYDKYKPLKQAGACSECRKKAIKVNYRTLCATCANARGVCEGCCEKKDPTQKGSARELSPQGRHAKEVKVDEAKAKGGKTYGAAGGAAGGEAAGGGSAAAGSVDAPALAGEPAQA
ncbi:hypothetical protein T484DRAFT_1671446 [Baffinella frigidus]|nr:hypothetical protein T484DRAFT_1671446 [Cryptophyta sp. CCMP2293]